MNQRIYIYAPVEERTVDGFTKTRYVAWATGNKFAEVNPGSRGSGESVIADRVTAARTVEFRIRYRSEIDERYVIRWNSEDYDIEAIQEMNDLARKSYLVITAVRRSATVTEITDWGNNILMDYTQGPETVTGTEWTITAGTLPPPIVTGKQI
jgi:head-tail adaptor